jgi:hypothetical protein
MENSNHKGSELNNVQETWNQNEKNLHDEKSAGREDELLQHIPPASELDRIISAEASDYDHANKEERVLSGERTTEHEESSDKDQSS